MRARFRGGMVTLSVRTRCAVVWPGCRRCVHVGRVHVPQRGAGDDHVHAHGEGVCSHLLRNRAATALTRHRWWHIRLPFCWQAVVKGMDTVSQFVKQLNVSSGLSTCLVVAGTSSSRLLAWPAVVAQGHSIDGFLVCGASTRMDHVADWRRRLTRHRHCAHRDGHAQLRRGAHRVWPPA